MLRDLRYRLEYLLLRLIIGLVRLPPLDVSAEISARIWAATSAMIAALADPAVRVALSVRHAGYEADAEVPWTMRQEWLSDLGA